MNVFRYELRAARVTTVIWIVAIIALTSLYLSIYPAFSKDSAQLLETIHRLPAALHHILGLGGNEKLFSFLGFFGNVFPFVTLIGGIQAAVVGLGLLSKEPASNTTDFLLSKPRSRVSIYIQKLLSGVLILLVTEVLVAASSYGIAKAFGSGDIDMTQYLLFWGAFALIQFWLFSLGLLVSQIAHRLKSVAPFAIGISFGFFLLALFGLIVGDDTVRWMTPFRFIDYQKIVTDSAYDLSHLLYGIALIVVFGVVSFIIYTRKDIPAAI